jgi:hypothetical protein
LMRAGFLVAVLVSAALLFSVLALSGIYKTGEPGGREVATPSMSLEVGLSQQLTYAQRRWRCPHKPRLAKP